MIKGLMIWNIAVSVILAFYMGYCIPERCSKPTGRSDKSSRRGK